MRALALCLCLWAAMLLSGCAVWLSPSALTEAERSAVQAHVARVLADRDSDCPEPVRVYLRANERQWAGFVSAAKRRQWSVTQPD